jgi:hypothetical protein
MSTPAASWSIIATTLVLRFAEQLLSGSTVLEWLKEYSWLFGLGGVGGCIVTLLRWAWDAQRLKRSGVDGPELLIRYDEREYEGPDELKGFFFMHPIRICNLSKDKAAYNIRIRDLVTPDGKATFLPRLVTFIGADGVESVDPHVDGAAPPLRHSLAQLFARSYKDTSTDELMDEKSYWLSMDYEDAHHNKFEGNFELLYQRWKHVIRTGHVHRKAVKRNQAKYIVWLVVSGSVAACFLWWSGYHRPNPMVPGPTTIVAVEGTASSPINRAGGTLVKIPKAVWPCSNGKKFGYGSDGLSTLPGGPNLKKPYLLIDAKQFVMEDWSNEEFVDLYFEVTVTNRGESSIAKDWSLCYVQPNQQAVQYDAETISPTRLAELGSDAMSLTDVTFHTSIEHGHAASGWLLFQLPKEAATWQGFTGSLQCHDYLEHKAFETFVSQ